MVVAGKSAAGLLALVAGGSKDVKKSEGDGGNPGVSSQVAAVVGVSPVSDISDRAADPDFEPPFGRNPTAELIQQLPFELTRRRARQLTKELAHLRNFLGQVLGGAKDRVVL